MRAAALALGLAACVPAARAQSVMQLPRLEAAEIAFQEGVTAFEAGDYATAYRVFWGLYSNTPDNQKTTAAMLLAAQAKLRAGEHDAAAVVLNTFLREYPTSRYADAARTLLQRAETPPPAPPPVHTLGLALPLTLSQGPLTQAFFNGVRLAVDAHNAVPGGSRVRMVFRNSFNTPVGARSAVGWLREADVVLGPLFSEEALAAGAAADSLGVPLVVPLATDDRVARERRLVFQANPPLEDRGRLLARFAAERLGLDTLGTAYDTRNETSQALASAFATEALRFGAPVPVQQPLSRGWASVVQAASPEGLRAVDGLYLPVSGTDPEVSLRAALGALDRAGLHPTMLGDAEWAGRAALRTFADRFRIVYANDFWMDPLSAEVTVFRERYRGLTGQSLLDAPFTTQRLAATGYDLARFLLATLDARGDRPLAEALVAQPATNGVGVRLDFDANRVNEGLFFQRVTPDGRVVSAER